MTDLLRRFRGLGVALVVLAISAGAAFAAAPRFTPASDPTVETTETTTETTETTTETTETTTVDEGDGTTTTTTETSDGADVPGAHGELVSTAAQMPTPDGFPNHGAFVSCVAKMGKDVLASTVVWADVTPESCGITPDDATDDREDQGQVRGGQDEGRARQGQGQGPRQAPGLTPRAAHPAAPSNDEAGATGAGFAACRGGEGAAPARRGQRSESPDRTTAMAFSRRSFAIVRYFARLLLSTAPIEARTSGLRMTSRRSSTASLSWALAVTRLSSRMGSASCAAETQPSSSAGRGCRAAVVCPERRPRPRQRAAAGPRCAPGA